MENHLNEFTIRDESNNAMDLNKLWTKDFVVIFVINFLVSLQFFLLMVVIASYAMEVFHASTSIAGLISGSYIIGVLFGRVMTGRIIGSYASKRVLIIGSVLFFITTTLYLSNIGIELLIINRLINGFAYGITATVTGTIIAQIVPISRQGEGISYYTLSSILAMAIGPFLGILLAQHASFQIILIGAVVLAVLSLVLAFTVVQPFQAIGHLVPVNNKRRLQISDFLEYNAIPIASVSLIIGVVYASILSFLSLYAEYLNLEKAASFFFAVFAIAILLSRPYSGRVLDVKGPNVVVYPSLIILALGMFLLSQANHGSFLLIAGALIGLGWGNYHSCGQAMAIKVSPPHRYGLATSTYFALYEIGLGGGPYLCGYIVPFTGWRYLYVIMGIVVLGAMVFYYHFCGRKSNYTRQEFRHCS